MEINYRDVAVDSKFYNESCTRIFGFKKHLANKYSISTSEISWKHIQQYLTDLIKEKKLILRYVDISTDFGGYSECKNNTYIMIVNKNKAIIDSRLRFTLTHELAHILLHLPPATDLGFRLPRRKMLSLKQTELQADFAANDLLMSSETIREKLLDGTTFQELQNWFMVSQSAMQTRLHNYFVFELGYDFEMVKSLVNKYRYENSYELIYKIPINIIAI